ncbi:phage holin [Pelotomaculum propionicicum]|uniref:LL-H family phage holin n=1 Tax=Pelotomaculum propionicicum TaxID=258475 RepID=A0A4Y7RX81_9FIRM|nr:phage holin [Pelotomaculum propionicicum]TEB13346.1 hypothetical protein Pmgp_00240 [Pelotomaculum propionicicum]
MQETINQYAIEIILAVLALLTVLVKGWLNTLKQKAEAYFEAKTTSEQRSVLALLGKEAFSFAETVYKELDGPAKLARAVEYVEQKAQEAGITVAAEEIRAVVEAAWLEDKRKEMPAIEAVQLETIKTAE